MKLKTKTKTKTKTHRISEAYIHVCDSEKRNAQVQYRKRHNISTLKLQKIISSFQKLNIVIVGDLIVDEYIECERIGTSREDQNMVMAPIQKKTFIGGASITAAHAKSLGANVSYFSVIGVDHTAEIARLKLQEYNVTAHLLEDICRPTTLKKRYRNKGKTLLRLSELEPNDISQKHIDVLLEKIKDALYKADLLVFSDFNYGCLPQKLVDEISSFCLAHNIPMVADSQSSSQIGDITRFRNMLLITPTEYEGRVALPLRNHNLIELGEGLREKSNAQYVMITLGENGVLISAPKSGDNSITIDELESFNLYPKDIAGAGDSLFITTSMALVSGASIWESAYIGSVAAACQISRLGNIPLMQEELIGSF